MEKNAVIAVFPKDEQAYKAFMDLKENERIISAGLVTVQGELDFKLKDSFTTRDDSGWLTGSVFGSAIGLIGGPLGVLFGGTLGALVGADSDVAQVASDQVLLAFMATRLSEGDTAVLIVVEEDDEPFDEKMNRLTSELSEMFKKSHELEEEIRGKLGAIGYKV